MGAALALAATLVAQRPTPAPQAPATLSGVVVAADGGQPIRRAIVSLTGPDLPANVSAVTDDRGRFAFLNLRPGTYTATASKAAYLAMAYGAKAPGRPGTPVALTAGERREGLRLTLVRGAVLTGVVRDHTGAPATGIHVTVAAFANVARRTSDYATPPEGPLLTDDRGVYRAYGLAPGEYVVAATPRSSAATTVARLPPQTIEAALRELQDRAAGRAPSTAQAAPAAQPLLASAPVYYPGTPVARNATPVRVAAGEVREGLDFTIDFVPSATVEGRIAMSDGSPIPGVQLTLSPIGPPLPSFADLRFTSRQSPDGRFTYSAVTPGDYILFARGTPGTPPVGAGAGRAGGMAPGPDAGSLWAMAEFSVSGTDVSGLTLTLRPALRVSGRLEFDATTAPAPKDVTRIRVSLARLEGLATSVPLSAAVRPDGTFQIGGVVPGRYSIVSALAGPPDWWLRTAMAGGRDLLDLPLELGADAADVTGVVLTFTDRRSELSGSLQMPSGQATSDYTVIVFPTDRALWAAARRVRAARPASDGRFSFVNLPAGDYLLAALADSDPEDWRRPAFLDQVVGASVKVTVTDGAVVTQDLRIR